MIVNIGGVIYESRASGVSIFDIYSVYASSLEKAINMKMSKVLDKISIPKIQFNSIGIELAEINKRLYSVRKIHDDSSVPKRVEEALGQYNIVYEKIIKVQPQKIENLLESYDERDSSNGHAFEVMYQISRYCDNIVNKHISKIDIDYVVDIDDFGVRCEYSDGRINIDIIDEKTANNINLTNIEGEYKIDLDINKQIRCSLLPA